MYSDCFRTLLFELSVIAGFEKGFGQNAYAKLVKEGIELVGHYISYAHSNMLLDVIYEICVDYIEL